MTKPQSHRAVWFEPELRQIERWAALRRLLEAGAQRGESYALVRLTRALRRVRRVLGPQAGMQALSTVNTIVDDLAKRGQFQHALTINTWHVDDLVSIAGPFDLDVLRARHRQSQLLWRTGRTAEALTVAQEVSDISRSSGADDLTRYAALSGLAIILADTGNSIEARRLQQEVVEGRQASVGNKDPATLRAMIDLFMTCLDLHDTDAARTMLPEILETRIATFPARYWGRGMDRLLESNAEDFHAHQRLEQMLASGIAVSRREWPRDVFEM